MTKLETHIISSINSFESNETVTIKKCGLFIDKHGISQNFAVIMDDTVIIRIDHNCKGIYKKILKNRDKIDKKMLLGTDTISKFIINQFTEIDAEEMIENLFQYCDVNLIKYFYKNNISLKNMIHDTALYFDLDTNYFNIIDKDVNFKRIRSQFEREYNWVSMITIIPEEIKEEFEQLEWLSEYHQRNRDSVIEDLLNED